jgi:hypothetical protein
MRALATAIVLLGMSGLSTEIRAEQSGSCGQCRQQQQACMKNYSRQGVQERIRYLHEGVSEKISSLD